VNEDIKTVDRTARLEVTTDREKWRNLVDATKGLKKQ